MITFKDLKFRPHYIWSDCVHARRNFLNGYGVSVLLGNRFYSNGIDTYKVAILHHNHLCYDSGITEDVIGYQTTEQVSEIMKQVQKLPKN